MANALFPSGGRLAEASLPSSGSRECGTQAPPQGRREAGGGYGARPPRGKTAGDKPPPYAPPIPLVSATKTAVFMSRWRPLGAWMTWCLGVLVVSPPVRPEFLTILSFLTVKTAPSILSFLCRF